MGMDPQFLTGAAATAWLWKEFGKEIVQKATSTFWKRFKFNDAKQKYQSNIKKLHSTMRVLDKVEVVPLDEHYVDLVVLEKPEAYRRYGVDLLESNFDETKRFYNRDNRADAQLIVTENNRLFVLGKPGAGKTTLLKYLTILAAEEKIDKVPIFISFNSWAHSQKELLEFIIEQFDVCGFPDAGKFIELLLEKGNALFLFDGLDEVSEEGAQRGNMIYELENLVAKYSDSDNKWIITCRNAANDYPFDNFTYVELADLTDYQINVYSQKWFTNNPDQSTEFLSELTKEENQSLKEISHNPLLLGMLCLVYEETSSFPPKRGMVYKQAVDALTKRWDKTKGVQRNKIQGFTPKIEKKLLSFLAYEFSLENKVYFEQDNLEKKIEEGSTSTSIDSIDILFAIEAQHGLLTQRALHVFTFSHLTFQEYFTAQFIVDHLDTDNNLLDELFTRLNNQRWKEVFPLVASLISNPDVFFTKFANIIHEPIKKDKVLTKVIKNIDVLAKSIKNNSGLITSRMRIVALLISINRMIHIVQNSASNRSSKLANKLLRLLNIDETVIDLPKAQDIAEILCIGSLYHEKNRQMVNKAIELAAEHSVQTDFDIGHSYHPSEINLNNLRATLREELKRADETLTLRISQNVQRSLEKKLIIDTSFRIALDYIPKLTDNFVMNIKELEFPKSFASKEEWGMFKKKIIQLTLPNFGENVPELGNEHLPILEKFLKRNILFLDCLQQSNLTNYSDCVFSLTPPDFQGN